MTRLSAASGAWAPARVLLCALAAALALAVACRAAASGADAGAPRGAAAVVIERGAVASSQVVALGRDLVVDGRAAAGAAVVRGSARVRGDIDGDLVVVGGDAAVGAAARIGGDVFVLGGAVVAAPGARIEGRAVAYRTAPEALLVLAEGPALGLSPWSRVVVGAKLALIAAWSIAAMALVATARPALAATAEAIAEAPLRSFGTGAVAVAAMALGALFLASFLGVEAGVPLLALLTLAALVLKLWGTVAVFVFVGGLVGLRGARGAQSRLARSASLPQALLGLALLGALKFVPWVGVWTWSAATLVGVGASLVTKLGRREPWFA